MKRLLLLLILLIILQSCHRQRSPLHPVYRWDTSGDVHFDSAMLALEDTISNGATKSTRIKYYTNLYNIGKQSTNPSIQERLLFWEGRIFYNEKNGQEYAKRLQSRISTVDSVERPYNYHMLQYILSTVSPDKVSNYFRLNRLLKYFRHEGDSLMVGRTLYMLSHLMDYDPTRRSHQKCYQYLKQAAQAFQKPGLEKYYLRQNLNIAYASPNKRFADSIHKQLLEIDAFKYDTICREILLRNAYLATDSLPLLEENLKMLAPRNDMKNEYAINLTARGRRYALDGQPGKGLAYSLKALNLVDSIAPTYYLVAILHDVSMQYKLLHKSDSAFFYQNEMLIWRDSLQRSTQSEAVIASEAALKITEIHDAHNLINQRNRLIFIIVALTITTSAVTIVSLIYRRAKQKEISYIKMERELYRNRSSLAANIIAIQEKDKVLGDVEATISELSNNGKLMPAEIQKLNSVIKLHRSGEDELDSFIEVYEKLHPDFSKKLKADYPNLSESQLRLATYIAAGINNTRIARMLHIEVNSVKMNRHRLRSKFELATGNSLEDFLRQYL